MKWLLMFIVISSQVLAQNNANDATEEMLNKFIEAQRKMMEEVMKEFQNDDMMFDNFFDSEKLRDKIRKGEFKSFGDFGGFRGIGGDFEINQINRDDGTMEIRIKPKSKDVNLDIKTEDGVITIKSEKKVEEDTTGQQGSSTSISMSSYSRSISIPFGYKAKDPVADGEEVVIALVPEKKQNNNGRIPIGKSKTSDTL